MFPLGLQATRDATDATEIATIADEFITRYQQTALSSNNYSATTKLLVSGTTSGTVGTVTNTVYLYSITVANTGFPMIATLGPAGTNSLSRVYISIWRRGGQTNYYVTEVARYARP